MKTPGLTPLWCVLIVAILDSCSNTSKPAPICSDPGLVKLAFAPFPPTAVVTSDLSLGGTVSVGQDTIVESIMLGVAGPFGQAVQNLTAQVGAAGTTWSATVPLTALLGPSHGAPAMVEIVATVETNCGSPLPNATVDSEPFAVAPPPDAAAAPSPADAATGDTGTGDVGTSDTSQDQSDGADAGSD